ncbi:MAG: hypothetical protein WCK09_21140, partial [Bacteroidota bacterium]
VSSVNDCPTPESFHRKLTELTDVSLHQVDVFLQQQNPAHIDAQVDYILGKIDALGRIVVDESFLLPDELEGFRHIKFKSFSKSRLNGPDIGDWSLLGPVICYKTQKFAEIWLQIIQDVKDRLNLIRNMHKSAWVASTTASSQDKEDSKKFKLKFNTTVGQETFLFHFLVKSGIIDLPDRTSPQLFEWMVNNLESKNRDTISLSSVRNKYYTHEVSTLDYWTEKFLEGLEIINREREDLLRFIPK